MGMENDEDEDMIIIFFSLQNSTSTCYYLLVSIKKTNHTISYRAINIFIQFMHSRIIFSARQFHWFHGQKAHYTFYSPNIQETAYPNIIHIVIIHGT